MPTSSRTKKCPYCGEEISAEARKCRFCGEWLDGETVRYEAPGSSLQYALAEKYEIIEEIGRGGMAIVYKAVQKSLNRTVALKVIHRNLIHDKEFVARFHREAQVAVTLNHPNIVTVLDGGAVNDIHYMAMEYLDGDNLHDLIKQNGPLSLSETIRIIGAIADALDFAHRNGIIHRDVKSSNIIITSEGRAVLTDFGIAHAVSGTKLTQTGTIMGSPEYMSPEQAEGKKIDHRTDIYSLGVVMYECLTGRLPFSGDNYLTVLHKIIHEQPPDIHYFRKDIPHWISANILKKALAKNPSQRFQTAAAFHEALNGYDGRNKQLQPNKNTKPFIFIGGVMTFIFFIIIILMISNYSGNTGSEGTSEIGTSTYSGGESYHTEAERSNNAQMIDRLYARALNYIAENKLTSPSGACALDVSRELANYDKTKSREIIEKIVEKYKMWGDSRYEGGDYKIALNYYRKAQDLLPDDLTIRNLVQNTEDKLKSWSQNESSSLTSSSSNNKLYDIKGYVYDANTKKPLPGATVYIENSKKKKETTANEDGYFALHGVSKNEVSKYLIVNYIGYNKSIIPIKNVLQNSSPIKIYLESPKITTYKIEIKGGGGHYSNTKLKFHFSKMPVKIFGSGSSDSNDSPQRIAISDHDGDYFGFNGRDNVDLSQFASKEIYVILDSKWGSDKDSYMVLLIQFLGKSNIDYTEIDRHSDDLDYVNIMRIE